MKTNTPFRFNYQVSLLYASEVYGAIGPNGHLPRVSRQSRVSDDKGDSEVKPVVVHRYPENCLTAEKSPEKSELGDRLKVERPEVGFPDCVRHKGGERKSIVFEYCISEN